MTPPHPVTPEATTERSTQLEQTVLCGQQIPDMRDLCVRNGLAGIHPAAEMFPLMTDEEMAGLVEDVTAHGFTTPIAVQDGLVLDGRNRLIASWLSGVRIETRIAETDSPTQFAISENLHRRHLTNGQRAFIGVKILPMLQEEARLRMLSGVKDPRANLPEGVEAPRARDKAGEVTGTSGRSVGQAQRIRDKAPDLQREVESGVMSLHAAEQEALRRDRAERVAADPEAYKERPRPEEPKGNWAVVDAVLQAAQKTEYAARVAGRTNEPINEQGREVIETKMHKMRTALDFLESWLTGGGIDKALMDLLEGENRD